MRGLIVGMVLMLSCMFAAPVFSMEIGEYNFDNSLTLFHVETDSMDYPYQMELETTLSKKDFPIWASNKVTFEDGSGMSQRYDFKTDLGYKVNDNIDFILERQDWNYHINEVIYRAGVRFTI